MTAYPDAAEIGILGGSGIYDLAHVEDVHDVELETPFGTPSDAFRLGRIGGRRVAFLARHGRGHRLLPSEIDYRANLYGFKMLGVTRVLSASAVGSLRSAIEPRHVVVPDQFIDRTRGRRSTFFGNGLAAHVSFADPVCADLCDAFHGAALAEGAHSHRGGTYLCMEGPAFSTRAESKLYRAWGADVIGMTNLTEAKLAREAELCYATLALVTDWDAWREHEAAVTVDALLDTLKTNTELAARVLVEAVRRVPESRGCGCGEALRFAIITADDAVDPAAKDRLHAILDSRPQGNPAP